MKRLIDTTKKISFKNWITQHAPKCKWDFNDPIKLRDQFINVISESRDIDLKTIFDFMFAQEENGLTFNQNGKFLDQNY
jgi:hypothetical protein